MMSEVFYDCMCLDCGVIYTEDNEDNLAVCNDCGSEELEWSGFKV